MAAPQALIVTSGRGYGGQLIYQARFRNVTPNLLDDRNRFIKGGQQAARIVFNDLAQGATRHMRDILKTEVRARRARFAAGPDFNDARNNIKGASLRDTLASEDMWRAGPFGFTISTQALRANPRTESYWRRVNDGAVGQTFPLLIFGRRRARTATNLMKKKRRRDPRGSVITARYRAPGYRFIERGWERAEADWRKPASDPRSATYQLKYEMGKHGIPFDGRRRGRLPRAIGGGEVAQGFRFV